MHEDVGVDVDFEVEESNLALQLKEICYVNGREKDPKKSASIFHKLALLYMKKCPDKISLIQSAALFNAAIIREPDNITDIEQDLEDLCFKILEAAGVDKKDANLISAAKTCKKAVLQFRSDTMDEIQKLSFISETAESSKLFKLQKRKVVEIEKLQHFITKNYLSIMGFLSDFCLSIMGPPPSHCRFALVGMGSLAKKEITPYSDFENVIVLEEGSQLKENYCEIIEYFRWFSVIFQIILINIGETIVPSISIPSLNDFNKPNGDWFFDSVTPSGISFDGLMPYACKMPLGRTFSTRNKTWTTELIKPSSAMASYLDREQNLKNGYHLAEVLSKTCFVAGDRRVFEDFDNRKNEKLTLHRKDNVKFSMDIKKQILDDKLKFDVNTSCSDMYTTSKFNLKRVIYRSTTIFVSALGTFYGIKDASCFEIIEQLRELGVINDKDGHYLKYAVAIACEVRLKIYMKRKRQSDWIENRTLGRELVEILHVVGGRCIVDYFTIARAFQIAVTSLNFDGINYIKLSLDLDYKYSVDICCKLRLHHTCIQVCSTMLTERKELSVEDEASCYYYSGISLLDLERPQQAFKHFKKELQIRKKLNKDSKNKLIADSYYNIGRCYALMTDYNIALKYFRLELNLRKELTEDVFKDYDVAFCLRETADCLLNLNRTEEALENFKSALEIWNRFERGRPSALNAAHCLLKISVCWTKSKNYDRALSFLYDALELRKKISSDESTDVYVAEYLRKIGVCLMNLEKYNEALETFEQSLTINKRLQETKLLNEEIALCDYNINICKEMLQVKNIS